MQILASVTVLKLCVTAIAAIKLCKWIKISFYQTPLARPTAREEPFSTTAAPRRDFLRALPDNGGGYCFRRYKHAPTAWD